MAAASKKRTRKITKRTFKEWTYEQQMEALRFYAKHLVGLRCLCQPLGEKGEDKGPPFPRYYSGFVMQIRRKWWWVTAGHIVYEIDKKMRDGLICFSGFHLIDRFGPGKDRTFDPPFEFLSATKFFCDNEDSGIDYAAVEIDTHTVRLLKSNKIVAVPKSDWSTQDKLEYSDYFMLGFPKDDHEQSVVRIKTGYIISGNATPSAIHITKSSKPDKSTSAYPRFVGELKVYKAGDIVGMSGGPILAFVKDTSEHRVIAVQSGWDTDTRMTYGFMVSIVGKLVEKELRSQSK